MSKQIYVPDVSLAFLLFPINSYSPLSLYSIRVLYPTKLNQTKITIVTEIPNVTREKYNQLSSTITKVTKKKMFNKFSIFSICTYICHI